MLVLKLVDISPEELPEFIMFKLLSKCEIVVTIWLEVFPNLRFLTYQSFHLIMAFLYEGRQFSCHIDWGNPIWGAIDQLNSLILSNR